LILFEFRGRTIFDGDAPGRQNLVGRFESDHESYRRLNDLVSIAEAADDETAAAALLALGSQGYLRSTTMRGFTADEMRSVIAKAG